MGSISTSIPFNSDSSSSTDSSPIQSKINYSDNRNLRFKRTRPSSCSHPSFSTANSHNGYHSITQPASRCPTPLQLNYQTTTTTTTKTTAAHTSSPTRYPSTPPSSRCFADTVNPIPTFVIKEGEKSNNVDFQVKLALTDLLNCEDIKADQETRLWVQNRLMDTEHRLKARRKSRILNVHID